MVQICHASDVSRTLVERVFINHTSLKLVVSSLEVKAWQTQVGDTKNVVMRLKSTAGDTGHEKDGSEDFAICMTAEKFRVLHHELKAARALMDAYK